MLNRNLWLCFTLFVVHPLLLAAAHHALFLLSFIQTCNLLTIFFLAPMFVLSAWVHFIQPLITSYELKKYDRKFLKTALLAISAWVGSINPTNHNY